MDKNIEKKKEAEYLLKMAKKCEKEEKYMESSTHYSHAGQLFREIGEKKGLDVCKKKITEMNKLVSEHEFKNFSFAQKIEEKDAKEIENYIKNLSKKSLSDVLKTIAYSERFSPKIETAKNTANKTMPLMMQLASTYAVDDKGNTIRGSDNGTEMWLRKMYGMQLQISSKTYLIPLFKLLIKNKKVTKDKLYRFINKSNIIENERRNLILKGLESFLKQDYISSLHILTPQFEGVFLNVSSVLGINTIKVNRGQKITTQAITFSEEHLDSSEFQEKWGKDYCELINYILFRPLGMKIRHKVAHGEIQSEECNFFTCLLVIFLFIIISAKLKNAEPEK